MENREIAFRVGDVFNSNMPLWEGAMYSYQDDMHVVLLSFRDIRLYEKQAIESGLYRFGLYVEEEVIFLLFKAEGPYGQRGIAWHDMPYSWHKVEREARTLPTPSAEIPASLGVMMFVFLLDAPTGRIVAQNAKNASHDFTRQLHDAIYQQSRLPYDHEAFHDRVAVIRQHYPTPEEFALHAQAKCLGGIYEAG